MISASSDGISDYLDSLANLGIEPSLAGIKVLCRELGDPQNRFDVIQVTGTNGKTSTSGMIQALLTAEDVKCGLYLSPHLESYRERISVDGTEIGGDDFEQIGRLVKDKTAVAEKLLGGRAITQFEVITALALVYFARRQVGVAVLEVGMGGRWDATSVTQPKVAVITNVTMDHADWLGPTPADIADEKSYVIKNGTTAVIGPVSQNVADIFIRRAKTEGATVLAAGKDHEVMSASKNNLKIRTGRAEYEGILLKAAGPRQPGNALSAVAAVEAYLGRALDIEAVKESLAEVCLPGRAELFKGSPDIFMDGAHNQAGVGALVEYLNSAFAGRRLVPVISILRDKAAPGMVAALSCLSSDVIFTKSSNSRCLEPDELALMAAKVGLNPISLPSLEAALSRAILKAGSRGLVVIAGSLYLVGEARKLLKEKGVIFP